MYDSLEPVNAYIWVNELGQQFIIGLDKYLSTVWHQTITWNNADLLKF